MKNLPVTLSVSVGQAAAASSLPVVIATDQSNVPVSQATASNLNSQVVGSVAHNSTDSGNPVKIGGRVINNAFPAAITNGNRADFLIDSRGKLMVNCYNGSEFNYFNNITLSNTTETPLLAAAASTNKGILFVYVCNGGAASDTISFRDSTGGTVRFIIDVGVIGSPPAVFGPLPMPLYQAAANNNWTAQAAVGTGPIHIFAMATNI